jgi:hypothetical protein
MGRSPLASALEHLAEVALLSVNVQIGQTPAELAQSYSQTGWQVDQAALRALASVDSKGDSQAVSVALRAVYLEETVRRLQAAVKATGGFQPLQKQESDTLGAGTCTVFVDGLRYDVAVQLQERLISFGTTNLDARCASLSPVTASGKAWCSPVSAFVSGAQDDFDFSTRVSADSKPLSGHNFRKLPAENGVQSLSKYESGDPQDRALTEAGALDL